MTFIPTAFLSNFHKNVFVLGIHFARDTIKHTIKLHMIVSKTLQLSNVSHPGAQCYMGWIQHLPLKVN